MATDIRLIYRVILKGLAALALLILTIVFVNSLFVEGSNSNMENRQTETSTIRIDVTSMNQGEIKKIHWQGQKIAILYRQKSLDSSGTNSAKYFVYFDKGDSGNCPLFYRDDSFKDICSGKFFDSQGNEKGNEQHGFKLKSPPHYFDDGGSIIIGYSLNQ